MKERIYWIDILKGLLLMLICIGHFGNLPEWISPLIRPTSMFYVPMFFMLSGYLLSVGGRDFRSFVLRKVKTLLLPYMFFSILFIVLDWNTWLHPATDLSANLHRCLIEGTGVAKASPLWFVMALFGGEILCYFILHRIGSRTVVLPLAMLALSLCALIFSTYSIHLPLQVHLLPSVAFFMLSGYLLHKCFERVKSTKATDALAVASLTGGVVSACITPLGDMHFNEIHNYPMFFLCPSIVGGACFWVLSRIDKLFDDRIVRFFSWIARNGMVVLACHIYVAIMFDNAWQRLGVVDITLRFLTKCIFVSLLLRFAVVPFVNKYCYMFIGLQNKKK